MNKRLLYLSTLLVVLLSFSSCSKKKNNFFSRTFHETTTHFNGYFNAREGVREAISGFEKGRKENWEEPLPIIIFPSAEEGVAVYGAMDKALEKCSKVIDRHSMLIKKKQYNDWIDDSYLLMGISYFYKREFADAEETFKYITKQFKKEPIRHEANLWMARMAIEKGNLVRAQSLLDKLEEHKTDFPKGMNQTYYEVYTHLHMKQQDYEKSIDRLKMAIGITKKKDRRARQTFLLAQLYDVTGQSQKSVRKFGEVVKMNPNYEMKFYAQINQALAFDSRSNSEEIRGKLGKMLRDEKYVEFRDQIYYALAEVEFAERQVNEGIEMLLRSTEASVNNNRQKGKSFYRLADIYFEERNYEVASQFFDSTMTYLPSDYPKYELIKATQESLSDLVYYLRIVNREDSLQTLAQLDEAALNKKLRKIIRDKQAEEEERIRKELEEQQAAFAARQNSVQDQTFNNRNGARGGAGKWYFYNEASKSIGFAEFRSKYGSRELKDNWRRKDKGIIELDLGGDDEGEGSVLAQSEGAIPTMDGLKSNIPFGDEAMKASKDTMAAALFEVGKIYKDRLEDFENAIEAFEDLNVRIPGSAFEQMAYYQLYRLFLKKEEDPSYFPSDPRSTSAYYAMIITEDYPESEFAKLIEDPEYVASNQQAIAEELEAYEGVFRQYRMRRYTEVLTACLNVMNNDEGNRLLPKYYLLRAMAIAGKKDRDNYVAALREVVGQFPETEEGKEAARLLGLLDEPAKKEEEKKEEEKGPSKEKDVKPDGPKGEYVLKEDMSHYFAMIVTGKDVRMSDLKAKVSDFNMEYYSGETFKVTNSFVNSDAQIILVRTLENKEEAMNYLLAFENEKRILLGVNDKGFDTFVITSKNFASLFKTKDISGYVEFFNSNYR